MNKIRHIQYKSRHRQQIPHEIQQQNNTLKTILHSLIISHSNTTRVNP